MICSQQKTYKGHNGKVQSLAWNSDGTMLASGSVDSNSLLWTVNQQDLVPLHPLRGHTEAVQSLCWNPTHPNYIATASTDKSVRIYDSRQNKSTGERVVTPGENINLSWSPNGKHIAVGNDDDVITIIDTRKLQILYQNKYNFQVNEFGWNKSGNSFFMTAFGGDATNKTTGTVEIFQVNNTNENDATTTATTTSSISQNNSNKSSQSEKLKLLNHQYTVQCHTAACYCIDFDPTGTLFAVGSADANVSLWTLQDLVCIDMIERHENPIRALSFNYNGTLLASGSEHKFIDIASVPMVNGSNTGNDSSGGGGGGGGGDGESGNHVCRVNTNSLTNALQFHPTMNILAYADDSPGNVHVASFE